MKNRIINTKYLPALLFALGTMFLCACSDFLDREPEGRLTNDDIPAGTHENEVFGLYAAMRSEGTCGLKFIAVHSIRSDDADKGSSVGDGTDAESFFDNFNYITDHWLLNGYWTDHYALINLCNNIITDIENEMETMEISQGTMINLGEAKFFRAYSYFNLVRAFGEIPKIDFVITADRSGNVPKSSVNDIYALIDDDLNEAASLLPISWEPKYLGRLTSGAAKSLQAKTALTRGNWSTALNKAQEVINSGMYNLNTPYDVIFTEKGENCSESIFEVQAYYTLSENYKTQYAEIQGVRGSGTWDMGWGWNTPNQLLADSYEGGDPRKDATLLYSGKINTPYGEAVPAATADVPRAYWNKKVYTDPAIRAEVNSYKGYWVNVRMIRYADVVLMAAEAANELGNTNDALNYLEMVRARARGTSISILPKITTTNQVELRNAIRHERRVECGMEHDRFFDLVRWGIDVQVLRAAGKTNYQTKHRLLPIPQGEIDKSGGVLIQNPDYQ